jgi:hypothetical protein
MNKVFALSVLALSAPAHAADATPAPESCARLRAEIAAQKGIPEAANLALLRKISGRVDCKFTAPEVYRAALADRPLLADDFRGSGHDSDDDDHD